MNQVCDHYTMGRVCLKLHFQNDRWYVLRTEGLDRRLVYFGTIRQCLLYMDAIRAIYEEGTVEV